jgi:preprotein translocase subunit YajC
MKLQPGDCVKTESGEVGKVVRVSRLTVFVAIPERGKVDSIKAFIESQLAKVEKPPDAAGDACE